MKFFNTIYPYGLNSKLFIKIVKSFFALDIKYKNLKYENDYVSIFSLLTHQLNEKLQELKEKNQTFLKLFLKVLL